MTAGSNLVEVQQALVDLLAARPGLSGVQISYDMPQTELLNKSIWFEEADASVSMPVHRGGATQKMEEDITLHGMVQVLAGQGQTQAQADTQGVALLAEVQQQLAEKPILTDNIMWATMSGWNKTGGVLATNKGHASGWKFRVNIKARLYQ